MPLLTQPVQRHSQNFSIYYIFLGKIWKLRAKTLTVSTSKSRADIQELHGLLSTSRESTKKTEFGKPIATDPYLSFAYCLLSTICLLSISSKNGSRLRKQSLENLLDKYGFVAIGFPNSVFLVDSHFCWMLIVGKLLTIGNRQMTNMDLWQ